MIVEAAISRLSEFVDATCAWCVVSIVFELWYAGKSAMRESNVLQQSKSNAATTRDSRVIEEVSCDFHSYFGLLMFFFLDFLKSSSTAET